MAASGDKTLVTAVSDFYRLAGAAVRVEWGDERLRQAMGESLAHRLIPPAEPELVIRARVEQLVWPAGPATGFLVRDDARGLEVGEPASGLWHRLDAAASFAEFVCASPEKLPGHERAAPFRLILQAWLQRRGAQLLHAGAVGLPGVGAVLLAAAGGGGKSNTVLACANAGLQVLGEDYLAVDDQPTPRVWSLFNLAKVHAADVERFPGLSRSCSFPDGANGKALLRLGVPASRWGDGQPLRAILTLCITGAGGTGLVPASPPEVVKSMLTSLLMVLPAARRPLFAYTTRLAGRVPGYRLELGADREQVAVAIQRFLHELQP